MLDRQLRHVQAARAELAKVSRSTRGWSDASRDRFDRERMEPLLQAAAQLITAIEKAQEQYRIVERLQ
jgi:hypothetical protein